jgi:hypothetical protein
MQSCHEERHLAARRHRATIKAGSRRSRRRARPASALFRPAGRGSAQGRPQRAEPSRDARRARWRSEDSYAGSDLETLNNSRGRLGALRAGAPDARSPRTSWQYNSGGVIVLAGGAARRHRNGPRRFRTRLPVRAARISATPPGIARPSTACPTPRRPLPARSGHGEVGEWCCAAAAGTSAASCPRNGSPRPPPA